MGFFPFFIIANQWLTNCLLGDTNDLLEEIRRQGMTPAERKAEDVSRARSEMFWGAAIAFAVITLISVFFIFSALDGAAVERTQNAVHHYTDAELDAEYR